MNVAILSCVVKITGNQDLKPMDKTMIKLWKYMLMTLYDTCIYWILNFNMIKKQVRSTYMNDNFVAFTEYSKTCLKGHLPIKATFDNDLD